MLPIVTPAEMAAIDAAAAEPVEVLIGRAGSAVARAALDVLRGSYGRRVVVLAGKGNNGADGRDAASRLRRIGVRVEVVDAALAPARLPPADLVVDAAYGTGFHGEYRAPVIGGTPVLAVDIPSGVNGLTAEPAERVLAATRTVTFAALKPGLVLEPGATLAGDVTVAHIGLDVSGAKAHLVGDADVAGWLPERPAVAHKWQAAVWVVAGSPGMTGSATLVARAAQRAGAGYVRLSTPGGDPGEGAPTEAVGTALPDDEWDLRVLAGLERFQALVVGPGLGRQPAAEVRHVVAEAGVPVVVDGDGLSALGTDVARYARPTTVLTPHDGEYRRLTGRPPQAARLAAARDLAAHAGCTVLLKGPATVVADPDGAVMVTTAGDARLATAGTGDVLAGVLGALLALGMPTVEAAAAAAHVHGRAGNLGWARGLVAGDLVEHLPAVLTELAGH
ncbi:NAD(P)H-hydrate dehydratase [soil metagenome]